MMDFPSSASRSTQTLALVNTLGTILQKSAATTTMANSSSGLFDRTHHHVPILIRNHKDKQKRRQKTRRKKQVRFTMYDDVFDICHLDDMPDDMIDAVYSSPEEMAAIKARCKLLVMAMDEVDVVKGLDDSFYSITTSADDNRRREITTGVCFRGLEGYHPKTRHHNQLIRDQIYNTVMEIQSFEDQTGYDLSMMMSKLIQRFSHTVTLEAHYVALSDARAAAAAADTS